MFFGRCAGWLVGAFLFAGRADGSIQPVERNFSAHTSETPVLGVPMYSYGDSPSWLGGLGQPYIKIKGKIRQDEKHMETQKNRVLRFLHGWSDVRLRFKDDILESTSFIQCVDDIQQDKLTFFKGSDIQYVTMNDGDTEADIDLTFDVNVTGWHILIVTNCESVDIQLSTDFIFRNPYGFLNGWAYGSLPMNLWLFLGYALLMVVYLIKCYRNRDHMLRLQYAIIAVVVMGVIERGTWFSTYLEMNNSGGRACCPVRWDLSFSIALAVFKRSSSALLLLAVCLGYGVVRPRLERPTQIAIIALGLFYTAASLNLDLEKLADISNHGKQTDPLYFASLLVSICDVIIVFWIYFAMSEIQSDLREGQQLVKLSMYQTLARALSIWAIAWFVFTILEILVNEGRLGVSWKYWSLLVSFWDVFYLGILIQICYVWSPSPRTAQYAYSQQLPTSEDLDEFDQIGLELQHPESAAEFVIGDDDEDDDDNLSLDHDDLDDLEEDKQHKRSAQNGNGVHKKENVD
mmetsp:Transcript_7572/g.12215  ORF Transcript_7572/g.12215 Transcript_7572/m.12215 type:complete len:517 (+) Transcript_7572:79-1629(+)